MTAAYPPYHARRASERYNTPLPWPFPTSSPPFHPSATLRPFLFFPLDNLRYPNAPTPRPFRAEQAPVPALLEQYNTHHRRSNDWDVFMNNVIAFKTPAVPPAAATAAAAAAASAVPAAAIGGAVANSSHKIKMGRLGDALDAPFS